MREKTTIISGIILLSIIMCLSGCSEILPSENDNTPSKSVSATAEPSPDIHSPSADNMPTQSVLPSTEEITNAPSHALIVVYEVTEGEEGTFYLGQSSSEVRKILKDMDIHIKFDTDVTINADGFGFEFDKQNRLIGFGLVTASNTPTASGLDFGDTYEKMIEIYGTEYIEEVIGPDASRYEYKIGSHYFYVRIYNGRVNLWELSTESIIY